MAIGDVITAVNSMPLTVTSQEQVEQRFKSAGNVLELTVAGFVAPESLDAFMEARGFDFSDVGERGALETAVAIFKAVLVMPVLLAIFSVSIVEGFFRVMVWHCRKTINSSLSDKRANPDNILFDIMMAIWCGLCLEPGLR